MRQRGRYGKRTDVLSLFGSPTVGSKHECSELNHVSPHYTSLCYQEISQEHRGTQTSYLLG